jgi:uncharacterized membrane protein YraQ (UPF0718 family)
MLLLLTSILALFIGPALLQVLGPQSRALNAVDGFVVIVLAGLIGLHLLPESIATAGGWAALAALAGLGATPLLERGMVRDASSAKTTLLTFALAGLAVHGMFDGAALALELELDVHEHAGHAHHAQGLLGAAVLFHRIPIGLAIWWLVAMKGRRRRALGILTFIAAATAVGFAGARPLLAAVSDRTLAIVQALVAGMLIHAVFAHPPRLEQAHSRGGRIAAAAGALGAVAMLAMMVDAHPFVHRVHDDPTAGPTFVTLALEAAPALLLAFVGAGIMLAFLSPASRRWLGRGGAFARAARGMIFGLPLPICSCGVVPMYKTLIKAGVPTAAGMAFLIATPEIGLDAILISFPLLGPHLAIARVVCAAIVALLVGMALGGRVETSESQADPPETDDDERPVADRIKAGLAFGLGELFDHVAPWILAGLFVASLIEPLVDAAWLASLPDALEVPLLAVIGIPLYVCASGATPLVAVLMHKGLSAGAAMAFLLTGPATNIVTFGVLNVLHGRRVALAFGVFVTGLAICMGFIVNAWLPSTHIALPDLVHERWSPLNAICLASLCLLLLRSLARQGPRGFIDQLAPFQDHDHDHGHAHDNAHGHAPDHGH